MAAVSAEAASLRRRVEMLRETMDDSSSVARDAAFSGLGDHDMAEHRRRVAAAREELRSSRQELAESARPLARIRRELSEAVTQRRAIESLVRRRERRAAAAGARRAQKELDDIHAAHEAVRRAWTAWLGPVARSAALNPEGRLSQR